MDFTPEIVVANWEVEGLRVIHNFLPVSQSPPDIEITVTYQSDWNLVGLPIEVEDALYTTLFSESIEETLFSFDNGYNLETSLIQGEGYWLRFSEFGSTTITGVPIVELMISLSAGWNLISGITSSFNISNIQDPDEIIISGTIYEFTSGGYSNAEILEPGKGYWVRCYNEGEIIIPEITVTDIDGNVYETIAIGEQVWMSENLKVTQYSNGDIIPEIDLCIVSFLFRVYGHSLI